MGGYRSHLIRRIGDARRAIVSSGMDIPAGRGLFVNVRLRPAGASQRPLNIDLALIAGVLGDSVRFIQIGAFDGLTNDPLHDLITQRDWRGVLVEPQPAAFARLQATYSGIEGLTFLRAAVAEQRGTMKFWRVDSGDGDAVTWVHQISSLSREHVLRHIGSDQALASRLVGEDVETVTLTDLFGMTDEPVDVLQIDAEGFDGRIVRMLNLDQHRPKIVRFEHRNLDRGDHAHAVQHLTSAGYRIAINEDDTVAMLYEPGRGTAACR